MTISKKYSLQEVINMDQYVMRLAAYESSQGMMNMPTGVEDAIEFQKETHRQFYFFKRMIQNSECTFDELEQMVLTRHGPVPNPYRNMSMSESLSKMSEETVDTECGEGESNDFMDFFMDSLRGSMPEGTIMIGPMGMMPMGNFGSEPTKNTNHKSTANPIEEVKEPKKIEEPKKTKAKKTIKKKVVDKDGKSKSPKGPTNN